MKFAEHYSEFLPETYRAALLVAYHTFLDEIFGEYDARDFWIEDLPSRIKSGMGSSITDKGSNV